MDSDDFQKQLTIRLDNYRVREVYQKAVEYFKQQEKKSEVVV